MKIVRFRVNQRTRFGVLETSHIVEYSGTPFSTFQRSRRRFPLKQVVLLAPVSPSKIVLVGLNYPGRAAEMGRSFPDEPSLGLKPVSALVGPDDPIVYPSTSRQVDYEAELAIVMKRRCRALDPGRARDYILGYTCMNDVTARDLQARDGTGTRAKGFDTFCPIGPCIATDIDPNAVAIETYVNGSPRQSSNTKEATFSVEEIVAHVSQVMTLLPGDVIATGTPPGPGPVQPGDRVEVRIEGIGALRNTVVKV